MVTDFVGAKNGYLPLCIAPVAKYGSAVWLAAAQAVQKIQRHRK